MRIDSDMLEKIEDLLKLYCKEVESATDSNTKKIILYGSYARGDFQSDSDVDIMILVDTDITGISSLERKICDITYDFNDKCGVDIMPIVQSYQHFEHWKKADMFYRNVDYEGVILY